MSPDIFVDQLGGDRQAEMMGCFTSFVDRVDGFMRTPAAPDRLRFYQEAQMLAAEFVFQVKADDPLMYMFCSDLASLESISPGDHRIFLPLLDQARRAILINTD